MLQIYEIIIIPMYLLGVFLMTEERGGITKLVLGLRVAYIKIAPSEFAGLAWYISKCL